MPLKPYVYAAFKVLSSRRKCHPFLQDEVPELYDSSSRVRFVRKIDIKCCRTNMWGDKPGSRKAVKRIWNIDRP